MKSLRLQLAVWFGVSFMVLTATFMFLANRLLEQELRQKTAEKNYPEHPNWKIHGSYSEEEVRDIMRELLGVTLMGSLPLVGVAMGLGYWLARKSLRPIVRVNQQLQAKTSANLAEPITLPEADGEFRELLKHLNDLLTRLNASFTEMNEYAARVAHELRTPLSILRLKIEEAGNAISPQLAEEFQAELQQLTHVVDQSLLIARAEQGRMKSQRRVFDLAELVADVAGDFSLIGKQENRQVRLLQPAQPANVCSDPKHTRQIIHNLFTNAWRHGSGDITLRIKRGPRHSHALLITNPISPRATAMGGTLGLGLRVVDTLLGLEPDLKCRRRNGGKYYSVRLLYPDAAKIHDAGL